MLGTAAAADARAANLGAGGDMVLAEANQPAGQMPFQRLEIFGGRKGGLHRSANGWFMKCSFLHLVGLQAPAVLLDRGSTRRSATLQIHPRRFYFPQECIRLFLCLHIVALMAA